MNLNKSLGYKNLKKNFIKKKKIFIITGKNSFYRTGFSNYYKKNFKYLATELYFKKNKYYPGIKELKVIVKKIKKFQPELIIAIGGGIIIDYAKLANVFSVVENININSKKIFIPKKKCELLVIPITAGSGAEVTKFSVLFVRKKKISIESHHLIPNYFSLIPQLVIKSSFNVRLSSAFDAFAQAIESMFSKYSTKESLRFSIMSLKYLNNNLLNFIEKPNILNSTAMLKAAHFSGKAINISKTNFPHSISYFFTSNMKIPHGIAVSIFFKTIIKFYYYKRNFSNKSFKISERFDLLFKALKLKNFESFLKKIDDIYKKTKLNKYYKKKVINLNFKRIILSINKDRLQNAPIDISLKDIKNIILNKF